MTPARYLDGMPQACYCHSMANIQMKNVPEHLHKRIRAHAKRQGRTIRDLVLEAVTREITRVEFRERLRRREPVDLGRPAAASLRRIRAERDKELGA